jgi:hypothetical protein
VQERQHNCRSHPVKVGICCAVSARRIVAPVFLFNEMSTLPVICELQLLHCERHRPSGMLIHRQNSYASRGKLRTGRRETQNRGPCPHSKNIPCICTIGLKYQNSTFCPHSVFVFHMVLTINSDCFPKHH